MTTLYSLRTEFGDMSYRITKFVDGEVEASYLTSEHACECPAGARPSCRHRQMLPQMLAHGIANTHWFMDWDRSGSIVDFNGASKRLYDELAAATVGEAQHVEEDTAPAPVPPGDYTAEIGNIKAFDNGVVMMQMKNIKPWRRL
jgi:hypothetical protein